MPRPPSNFAGKEFKIRLSKDLRKAFIKHCQEVRGESAASRLRFLMFNDLPKSVQKQLSPPVEVTAVDQDYRRKEPRAAGSSSRPQSGQDEDPGPVPV